MNFVKGTDKVAFVQEVTAPNSGLTYTAVSAASGGEGLMFSATGVFQKTLESTTLSSAVTEIEGFSAREVQDSGSGISAGKVFTFEVGGHTYIAVGRATSSIGSLVRLSGVTGVTNVTQVVDLDSAGQNIVGGTGAMTLSLGGGNDTVTVTAINTNDYLQMGSGADRVIFSAAGLTSADTLVGGAGVDSISFSGADTLGDAAFTNVTTFETLVLANGSNQLAISTEFVESGIRAIYGGSGADSISLAADTLSALGSGLTLSLGAGVDTVLLTNSMSIADSKFGGLSGVEVLDLADSTGNNITLGVTASAAGIRIVFDGVSGDTIDMSSYSAAVTVVSSDGDDWIRLGSGNDSISIPEDKLSTADTLVGGGGVDTLGFSSAGVIADADFSKVTSFEAIILANGTNTLTLAGSADTMGLASVFGGSGADAIDLGGVGVGRALYVAPGAGGDNVSLGSGNDTVISSTGADVITGGTGADWLVLAGGADTSTTVLGVDVFRFELATTTAQTLSTNNTVQLVSGIENLDASGVAVPTFLRGLAAGGVLVGGSAADYISLGTSDNTSTSASTLVGGSGADWLRGSVGADLIFAGAQTSSSLGLYLEGADSLVGSTNSLFIAGLSPLADTVNAGSTFRNANIIEARGGDDVLVASSEKDVFFYQTSYAQGADTIHDFTVGEDYLFAVSYKAVPGYNLVWYGDTVGAARDSSGQRAYLASDSIPSGTTVVYDTADTLVGAAGLTPWSLDNSGAVNGTYIVKFDYNGDGTADFTVTLVGVNGMVSDINSLFPPGGG